MAIHVALNHKTSYTYDRLVTLSPQVVRLRPAPHCRTSVLSYSLKVQPSGHFINWQQDPQGNYLARLVFPERVDRFSIEVDLVADMTVINPFDFFLEPAAEYVPFTYPQWLHKELKPFLEIDAPGPRLSNYLETIDRSRHKTVDYLVDLNRRLHEHIQYVIRLEPGVQTCEETLQSRRGSCRDSAWLLVQILRHLGLAARFVSGYLIQLTADIKSLDGPSGPEADFTDLHAWTEVYLPGAGWVGLDPTSGLLAGEGHLPLAATPDPYSAAPVSGAVESCQSQFSYAMSLERVREDPRVTKPYSDAEWSAIQRLGQQVDEELLKHDVRLTIGGEPTFVSIDDMEGEPWRTAALGSDKLERAIALLYRLKDRFSSGAMLHFGQGKWYPGEPLPRWALRCYWRTDGEPLWHDETWTADPRVPGDFTSDDALRFARTLAGKLQVRPEHAVFAYEDVMYYAWQERRLPTNVDLRDAAWEAPDERARLAQICERGWTQPAGCVLPLQYQWWLPTPGWRSGPWVVRSEEMFLIPGDSPLGFRLPLQSLQYTPATEYPTHSFPGDPFAPAAELPRFHYWPAPAGQNGGGRGLHSATLPPTTSQAGAVPREQYRPLRAATTAVHAAPTEAASTSYAPRDESSFIPHEESLPGDQVTATAAPTGLSAPCENGHPRGVAADSDHGSPDTLVRTAVCVEPREGRLYVFLPPTDRVEHYLELVQAVEQTAAELHMPVLLEGYPPPHDTRLRQLSITPDPGVIEVNIPPSSNWQELVEVTTGTYEEARQTRLGTEKFDLDGRHTGTGGGNHIVLGGPTPADSPFLRRPDLLRSLIGYWHNHPALSYLFSGRFVGPTSQAPRVDEGRRDAIYELQIAFEQIPTGHQVPPWLVDRVFRHLLVDLTGNTHRAEFCIDKLFSPDTAAGRLGLVEFRAFEMPPHARMSLTQQLLLRALVARFWQAPYVEPLADWDTAVHDRFLLPYFVEQDFTDVIEETVRSGLALESRWFAPHFEFRFPVIGEFTVRGIQIELRQAIEPWYVLGEEPAGGGTARFVDSSVERLQVRVRGMTESRHVLTCAGRRVPLHPTGTVGEYVAGVRYRAWQPPSCLHPTIPVDTPLVFDLYDAWSARSLGGCQYHVGHPGGLNPERFPVNAYEAESRRAARFFAFGHSPGRWQDVPPMETNARFPLTLDLRRGRGRAASCPPRN